MTVQPEQKYLLLCINLERSKERRQEIEAQCGRLGLAVAFVPAVDGSKLSAAEKAHYSRWRRSLTWRRHLTDIEVSCVLSHRKAVAQFLASSASAAVVLEDDALLSDDFPAVTAALVDHPDGWTIVRLETRVADKKTERVAPIDATHALVLRQKLTLGGAATLYSRKSAEIFMHRSTRFFEAFDNLIGRPGVVGDVILEVDPPLVRESGAPSTLEAGRSGPERAARRMRVWWRFVAKAIEGWSRLRRRP
ncbi:MAG: glycosyltransferase family 25 protein [Neomegalonema sp.]|nr:glycosyltransferase family 25 protein [Neomegalonema sp.]